MSSRRRKAKGKRALAKGGRQQAAKQGSQELAALELEEFSLEEYSGELPHPEILARFEEIVAGSASMIFDEMQANGKHRRKQENRVVRANAWTFAFAVVTTHLAELATLGFGGFLIWHDRPITGFSILVGQVALLRWGRKG